MFFLLPKLIFQSLIVRFLLLKHLLQLLKRVRGLPQQILPLLCVSIQLNQLVLVPIIFLLQFVLLFMDSFQFPSDLLFPVEQLVFLTFQAVKFLACVRGLRLDLVVCELQLLDFLLELFVLSNLLAHVLSQLADCILKVPFLFI